MIETRLPGFGAAAWAAWLAAVLVVLLVLENPFATVIVALALGAVSAGFRADGPEGRTAMLFVRIGLVVIAVRVILFGLTGHAGATTLVTLPEMSLPRWLGGFALGGRVTTEVVVHEIAEGLEIAALLLAFGVFLSIVRTHEIMRLLPRFLLEAGLVVGIAIAFVPTLLRTASDVRDAQRLRGHRFRGARSLRALVVPVLAGALERSLELAASMESRGYGRGVRSDGARRTASVALAGLLALVSGGALLLFARGPALGGAAIATAGGLALGWALRELGRASARTVYRAERADGWDVALIAVSAAAVAAAVAARALPGAVWSAHPVVALPALDLRIVVVAALASAPLPVATVRRARLRRAGVKHLVEARA